MLQGTAADDTRRSNTIGPITRGMAKKLQDEYSPQGQILFAIFGWKIGEQEDVPNLPKHGEGNQNSAKSHLLLSFPSPSSFLPVKAV
ncbi:hypothetical protein LR48_Vigan53s000200 [Vigna angularis]|uniref:Uncharacterized protein n=1 Tax=Phaseolus angularis TaxID=3914 RepID=A0A0L9T3N3_PHAAN|nr:hypothetical protein LR48_Vigan53s000200 [Vigna angularis]